MQAFRWCVLAAAFIFGAAFSTDSAGKACVKEKGQRGVGYDVHKTKVKDAYAPGGRRLLQDGHRVYEIEVPPLVKRDKPVSCTMSLANGQWAAPGFDTIERSPLAVGNSPFTAHEKRAPGSR